MQQKGKKREIEAAVVLTGPFFVVIVWLPLSLNGDMYREEGRHHYSHLNMMQQCTLIGKHLTGLGLLL